MGAVQVNQQVDVFSGMIALRHPRVSLCPSISGFELMKEGNHAVQQVPRCENRLTVFIVQYVVRSTVLYIL